MADLSDVWKPPTDADGRIDWASMDKALPPRDPELGFHPDWKDKNEFEQSRQKVIEHHARVKEAELEKERLRAGAPAPNRDAEFEFRVPRDVLRKVSPQPYGFDDVPRSIGEFAYYYSKATGHDPSGIIVSAVTAAASVIDDRYRLVVRPESNWTVSARQWSFLCGEPSTAKSPSIRAATGHIKAMHNALFQRWIDKCRAREKGEPRPELPALYTSDSTVAALADALIANERGLLMLTEEMSSWIGAIDSSNKGDAAKNRGDWLQLRDGGPRQINRVDRGAMLVPNWGVSVLAACTPSGLAKQMKEMPEDGLIQRFIPSILAPPTNDPVGDARPALTTWGQWLEWAWTATTSLYPRYVTLTAGARAMFDAEVREINKLVIATEGFSPAYASHLGKHPGMLGEIALTFHVFGCGAGGQPANELGQEAMQCAIRYLRKARRHAHALYTSILSSAPAFELASALARSIVAADTALTTISRDWMTQHCQMFRKADEDMRLAAVQILEDADWLSAQTHVKFYKGWPRGYSVHPKVFEIFAREGEQWRARRAAVKDAIGEGA
ncbi:MAG: DUF3987 domain-containing protein [Sphingobium sp.]|nr:DUF3987 domain-containing protein [Sphingobium sp.]